jgi:hypothetical protein
LDTVQLSTVGLIVGDQRIGQSKAGDCLVEGAVSLKSTQSATSDCQVSLVPTSTTQGVEVEVLLDGECESADIATRVELPSTRLSANAPTSRTNASGPQRIQAKIIGHDVLHIPTFITWANIEWYYDNYTVWNGTFPYGTADDGYWDVLFSTHGSGYYSYPERYEHYHYAHWYSTGFPNSAFPDVEAWAQPTAKGHVGGTGGCAFWFSPGSGWGSYPNLHTVDLCQYY